METGTRGRPKEYRNAADKQKAYRERKNQEKRHIAKIEALRNSKKYEVILLCPGDTCCCCGYTLHWAHDVKMRAWSLNRTLGQKYKYIPPVSARDWRRVDNYVMCPDCVNGLNIDIVPCEPLPEINLFTGYDEYVRRTVPSTY